MYVRWDGDSRVEVRVVADFKNKTCGLCGNYNGDSSREDEFITPDGSYVRIWCCGFLSCQTLQQQQKSTNLEVLILTFDLGLNY